MDGQTLTKQIVELEREHQNTIANVLRLEGAIAMLRQMLANLEKENESAPAKPEVIKQ